MKLPRETYVALKSADTAHLLCKIAVLFAAWFGLASVANGADAWPMRLAAWAAVGFFVNGLILLWHDAWHRTLFSNETANDLAGHALSWLFFTSFSASRHAHIQHHRFNRTAEDPDAYNAGKKSAQLYSQYYFVIFFGWLFTPLHFNLEYPAKFYGPKALLKHAGEMLVYGFLYTATYIALRKANLLDTAFWFWVVPVAAASPWMGLKSVSDHYRNTWRGDRFHTATTVRSNALVTYAWNGLNYHLEHHLYPGLPGYRLPAVHKHLRKDLEAVGSPIFARYANVFAGTLRDGPLLTDEDTLFTRKGRFVVTP